MNRLLKVKKRVKGWRPDRADMPSDVLEVIGILEQVLLQMEGMKQVLLPKVKI